MRVTMLCTRTGCDDGITAREYEEGETYDLSPTLSRCFILEGHARDASAPPAATRQTEAPPLRPKRTTAQKAPQRRKGRGSQ